MCNGCTALGCGAEVQPAPDQVEVPACFTANSSSYRNRCRGILRLRHPTFSRSPRPTTGEPAICNFGVVIPVRKRETIRVPAETKKYLRSLLIGVRDMYELTALKQLAELMAVGKFAPKPTFTPTIVAPAGLIQLVNGELVTSLSDDELVSAVRLPSGYPASMVTDADITAQVKQQGFYQLMVCAGSLATLACALTGSGTQSKSLFDDPLAKAPCRARAAQRSILGPVEVAGPADLRPLLVAIAEQRPFRDVKAAGPITARTAGEAAGTIFSSKEGGKVQQQREHDMRAELAALLRELQEEGLTPPGKTHSAQRRSQLRTHEQRQQGANPSAAQQPGLSPPVDPRVAKQARTEAWTSDTACKLGGALDQAGEGGASGSEPAPGKAAPTAPGTEGGQPGSTGGLQQAEQEGAPMDTH